MKNINKLMMLTSLLCIYPLVSNAAVTKLDDYFKLKKCKGEECKLAVECKKSQDLDKPECKKILCKQKPEREGCEEYCKNNPAICYPNDICAKKPESKDCICKTDPSNPICDISPDALCERQGYNVSRKTKLERNLDDDCLESDTITIGGTKCYKYKYNNGAETLVGDWDNYRYNADNCQVLAGDQSPLAGQAPSGSIYKCKNGKKTVVDAYKECKCPGGFEESGLTMNVGTANEYFNNVAMSYKKVDDFGTLPKKDGKVLYYYNGNYNELASITTANKLCLNKGVNCKQNNADPFVGKKDSKHGICTLNSTLSGDSSGGQFSFSCGDSVSPHFTFSAPGFAIKKDSLNYMICLKDPASMDSISCPEVAQSDTTSYNVKGYGSLSNIPYCGACNSNYSNTTLSCQKGSTLQIEPAGGYGAYVVSGSGSTGTWEAAHKCYKCTDCEDASNFDTNKITTSLQESVGSAFVRDGCEITCATGYIYISKGGNLVDKPVGTEITSQQLMNGYGFSPYANTVYSVYRFGNNVAAIVCAQKTGCATNYTNGDTCNVTDWKTWFSPNN